MKIVLIEFSKFKIILVAAGFFVVKAIDAHVCFLNLFGSVGERIHGVNGSSYCNCHFRGKHCAIAALNTFWCNSKDL